MTPRSDYRPPIGRTARASCCIRCGRLTIRGLDHDRVAADVRVDPTPLDRAGELTALLTGRRTYELTASSGAYRIDPRDPIHIAHRPAGELQAADVVASHTCRAEPLPSCPSRIPTVTSRQETTACPF